MDDSGRFGLLFPSRSISVILARPSAIVAMRPPSPRSATEREQTRGRVESSGYPAAAAVSGQRAQAPITTN
jgi:hypothetical protein